MASDTEGNVDDYLKAQVEEIEVLRSIFGDDWKTDCEADRSYSIEIKEKHLCVTLFVTLPETYPFQSPPTYIISAPQLRREQKNQLVNQLEEVYLQNLGETVLFQWVDKIKEYLSSLVLHSEVLSQADEPNVVKEYENCELVKYSAPHILHGEVISDRKSVLQSHVAIVFSVNEVKCALNEIKKNKKVAKATHNIYAYRISPSKDSFIQDCNDDGETNAGRTLLHLLQILNINNVLVVVSRWYGGIHLGSDRFRHINNAAKQALELAGLIDNNKKKP